MKRKIHKEKSKENVFISSKQDKLGGFGEGLIDLLLKVFMNQLVLPEDININDDELIILLEILQRM
jgi:hypothetical protein